MGLQLICLRQSQEQDEIVEATNRRHIGPRLRTPRNDWGPTKRNLVANASKVDHLDGHHHDAEAYPRRSEAAIFSRMAVRPSRILVSKEGLSKLGACSEALDQFEAFFPDGSVELSRAVLFKAMDMDLTWWVANEGRLDGIASRFKEENQTLWHQYQEKVAELKQEVRNGRRSADEYVASLEELIGRLHHHRAWIIADLLTLPDDGTLDPSPL